MGGIDIDFSQLKSQPDVVGGYVNAFKVGQDLARSTALQKANVTYAQDPNAGIAAANAVDPVYGAQLQGIQNQVQDRASNQAEAGALASGDKAGALAAAGSLTPEAVMQVQDHYATLNTQQQARAKALNETIATVGHALLGDPANGVAPVPVEQRLGIAQHMVQQLGLDPSTITPDDVTDQGLQAHIATSQTLAQIYDREDKQAQLRETMRHNLADEGKPQFVETKNPDGSTTQTLVNPAAVSAAGGGVPPAAAPVAPGGPVNATPQDLDALARVAIGEAGGEGPAGQAAVMHTVLNRARANPAQTISSIVHAPNQYEGITSPRAALATNDPRYQAALQLAQSVAAGRTPDPTGGATNFLNPQLQTQLGRAQPAWATKNGLRIGNHVFYGGAAPGNAQPYQVASNGPTPPPPASAPAAPAPAAGDIRGTPLSLGAGSTPVMFDPNAKPGDITSIPQQDRGFVQALIDGRYPAPTGFPLKDPTIQRYIREATTVDPGFDATKYAERQALYKSATSGDMSKQILQLNKTAGHLQILANAADALHNGTTQFGNNTINFWRKELGDPAITNFETLRDNVIEEVDKLFKGGAADVAGTKRNIANLSSDSSPAQFRGAIGSLADLIREQMNDQKVKYEQGMGGRAANFETVTPGAAQTLEILSALGKKGSPASPPSNAFTAGAPSRPSRVAPTGAGHLSDAQIRAQLGL